MNSHFPSLPNCQLQSARGNEGWPLGNIQLQSLFLYFTVKSSVTLSVRYCSHEPATALNYTSFGRLIEHSNSSCASLFTKVSVKNWSFLSKDPSSVVNLIHDGMPFQRNPMFRFAWKAGCTRADFFVVLTLWLRFGSDGTYVAYLLWWHAKGKYVLSSKDKVNLEGCAKLAKMNGGNSTINDVTKPSKNDNFFPSQKNIQDIGFC